MSFVPTTYEEWKHCITVECGIPLTIGYVKERIVALGNNKDLHTQKFLQIWGAAHHAQTLAWFQRAADELQASK